MSESNSSSVNFEPSFEKNPESKEGFVKRDIDEKNRYISYGKYLRAYPVENTDNSDYDKPWNLGIEYYNSHGGDWRICVPREGCCSPLRLDIIFRLEGDESAKEKLYPSCNFHTLPNKFRTITEGVSYKTILDISKWREEIMWSPEGGFNGIPRKGERKKGIFSFSVRYPHRIYPPTSKKLEVEGYLNSS